MKHFPTIYVLLFLSILLHGCKAYYRNIQPPTAEFLAMLNGRSKDPDPENRLNKMGLYSVVAVANDTDSIRKVFEDFAKIGYAGDFISPMIFYENGFFFQGEFMRNQVYWRDHFSKEFKDNGSELLNDGQWGVYYIEGNKLTAICYYYFVGAGMTSNQGKLCKFEGIVKGGRILEWKLVPPYPAFKLGKKELNKLNGHIVANVSVPVTYEFISFPEKSLLDSTKVWINKYRKLE